MGDSIDDATIENKRTNSMRICALTCVFTWMQIEILFKTAKSQSYFGRVTSNYDLAQETINEIEEQLNMANAKIIKSIPSLQQTKERIAAIGQTIGSGSSKVEIEPLARKITDLNKGMDIIMQDGNAASFPIAQHGYGTRSWISFLTLSAFVENQSQRLREDDEKNSSLCSLWRSRKLTCIRKHKDSYLSKSQVFKGKKLLAPTLRA